jgi:O-antigen/teichoic acid export membrane protein
MDSFSLKKLIIKGSFWTIIGQFCSLFITLLANIWLARLLSPHEFGQLGIIMFFIIIANILTEGGLSGALIRKQNATKQDYSTIFIFNLCISIICFLIILLLSGSIAKYYNDYELKLPLIISSIVLIINALQMVQNTKLMADMKYKKKSIYEIISVALSSIIGITCAYKGWGIWSLVILQLSRSFIKTILLWIYEGFYFKIAFSLTNLKEFFSFGINTTLSSIINIAFDNIYQLIIGKVFSITQVGYYYQAKRLNDVPVNLFTSISQGPVYAGLSQVQNDKDYFRNAYNNIISILLSILGLVTLILFFYSDIIVVILFGEKWANSGIYIKFLSLASFFYIQENFNRVIFKTYNQTRKILYLEILKKTFQILTIIIGVYYHNMHLLLIGFIISNAIGYIMNYLVSRNIINSIEKKELGVTFKIFFSILLNISLFYCVEKIFRITGYYTLLLIIIIIPTYLLSLKVLNINKHYFFKCKRRK